MSGILRVRSAGKANRPSAERPEETVLIEKVQEPVEVLTKFVEGRIQPMRFRWRGRVFTVAEVTGSWIQRVGEHREHFFSVDVGTRDHYELRYRARTSRWTLENIYLEG